jgi:hypothetical protein
VTRAKNGEKEKIIRPPERVGNESGKSLVVGWGRIEGPAVTGPPLTGAMEATLFTGWVYDYKGRIYT